MGEFVKWRFRQASLVGLSRTARAQKVGKNRSNSVLLSAIGDDKRLGHDLMLCLLERGFNRLT